MNCKQNAVKQAEQRHDLSKEYDRRSGGVSKRGESKTIEKEIKEITERKEKSSDYKIGSKGYIEDVEKISIKSGAKKALEFIDSDLEKHADELNRISDDKRQNFTNMLSGLGARVHFEELSSIKGDGSVLKPAPSPVGVSMEDIEGKANAFVEEIIGNLLKENGGYYYKNSALSAQLTKLEAQLNRHGLFDIATSLKKYIALSKGINIHNVSKFVSEGIQDELGIAYTPADTIKYETKKEIEITTEQIAGIGDFKYFINGSKKAREAFVKSLDEQFEKYNNANIDEYSNSTNNNILKSKILTRISEIRSLNIKYKDTEQDYNMYLDNVKERVEAEYTNRAMDELNRFWERINNEDTNIYEMY
ncbi:MAG: hypothetical protein ACM3TR_16775 [Caulobacteraceae bacterium]